MKYQWRNLITIFLICSFLTACSESKPLQVTNITLDKNKLFFSDAHNLGILDLNQDDLSLVKNKIFLQSLNYDKKKKQIVVPGYSPDSNFAGLLYFNGDKTEEVNFLNQEKGFAPIQLYQIVDLEYSLIKVN
ncbi:hypothetical protein AB1283_18900 [Bacillus sp. S13(2024)]|uniref:hypothetical protein n=1 Tax=unclassified Bacillus (in: firmicutes) TaxID=185979 RepID=UPI003D1D8975